jgi:hypothetical protein
MTARFTGWNIHPDLTKTAAERAARGLTLEVERIDVELVASNVHGLTAAFLVWFADGCLERVIAEPGAVLTYFAEAWARSTAKAA